MQCLNYVFTKISIKIGGISIRLLKAKKLVWTPCKLKRFPLESDKFQQTSEKSALAKYRDESSLFYSKGLFALWFIWPCGLAGHLPPCSPRQILLKEILSIATNVLALQRIVLTHTRAMQTKCTTGFASTKDIWAEQRPLKLRSPFSSASQS